MITLYTTHCPKCKVIEMKLKMKKIEYNECDDMSVMLEKGFKQAPILEVDGEILDFTSATQYINKL